MMRKYVACPPAIVLKYLMQFHHRASLARKREDKALFYFLNCDELRGQIKHIKPALMHMEYRIMPKDSCERMPSVGPFDNEMSLTDNLEHPLATCIQTPPRQTWQSCLVTWELSPKRNQASLRLQDLPFRQKSLRRLGKESDSAAII